AYSLLPDYLASDTHDSGRFDFMEYGFQLSRNFKALKVWLTFQAYGADKLRGVIEDNIRIMRHLGERIQASEDFELLAPVALSIACFRFMPLRHELRSDEAYLTELNQAILAVLEKEGRFFVTGTKIFGKTALRACCVNHRAGRHDVDDLFE